MLSRSGWSVPPGKPAWPDHEVHVWRTTLDWPPKSLAGLEQILSPDERARVERFHFEKDRRCHLVSRGWLRLLLGRYLDAAPNALAFAISAFGKPSLAGARQQRRCVSTSPTPARSSSSRWRAAVNWGGCRAIRGTWRWRSWRSAISRRTSAVSWAACRGPAARRVLRRLDPQGGLHQGQGRGPVAAAGSVRRDARARRAGSASRRGPIRPRPPLVAAGVDVADGYKAALAAEGAGWALKCWDWRA